MSTTQQRSEGLELRAAATSSTVVVGDDGTHHSHRAVDYAADEAARRGLPLVVLGVVREQPDPDHSLAAQRRDTDAALEEARYRSGVTADRVRRRYPELTVDSHVLLDPGPRDLAGHLSRCALAVVGSRGGRGLPAFSFDTVSRALLHAVAAPVVVVPDQGGEPPPTASEQALVVAGVTDDAAASTVLRAAATEAALRGGTLRVVHAYQPGGSETAEAAQERAQAAGDRLVAGAGLDPATQVVVRVAAGPADRVLREHSAGAALVVLGSRGPLALAGLAQQSVSRAVLDQATCPVELVLPGVRF